VPDEESFQDARDVYKEANDEYLLYHNTHTKNVQENWGSAKQTLFNRITANCSVRFMEQIKVLKFCKQAESEYDADALLRECEIKAGGSSSTAFEGLTVHEAMTE